MKGQKIAYTLEEAAEQVSVSYATMRRAVAATDPNAYPPPLRAVNAGTDRKRSYRVSHTELVRWFESLRDA